MPQPNKRERGPYRPLRYYRDTYGIPTDSLRREALAGRVRAIRARESCNAPLLICEQSFAAWLEEAEQRLAVPSVRAVAEARRESAEAL